MIEIMFCLDRELNCRFTHFGSLDFFQEDLLFVQKIMGIYSPRKLTNIFENQCFGR